MTGSKRRMSKTLRSFDAESQNEDDMRTHIVPKPSKPTPVVFAENGDGFSPLNDSSRLARRNDCVRYFGDRKKLILMRQLMWATLESGGDAALFKAMRKSELVPGDKLYDEYMSKYMTMKQKDVILSAYDKIKYRKMGFGLRVLRRAWIMCSLGGMIPKAWATLSSSSYTVAITVITSYMIQSQTEAQNLLNGRETWFEARSFVANAVQMGILVLGMLTTVQLINYMEYAWKSHGRIIREARFKYILDRYMEHNPTSPDYMLEYNTACDSDIAMMYYTLREEENDRKGSSAFQRWYELMWLDVDEDLIWTKVILPELGG